MTVVAVLALGCHQAPVPPPDRPGCGELTPEAKAGPTPGMMLVPAGPFWRGCNDALDTACAPDERPGRCITLSAFEIDRTEVTQADWSECVAAGECVADAAKLSPACSYKPYATPRWPMSCVDWREASRYCRWRGKRLPTEAEWEKAARGPDGRLYPWGNDPPECALANSASCGLRLKDVGSTRGRSPYGVDDLAGNVWEWVSDAYGADYYRVAPARDPQGPTREGSTERVGRGGGFELLPGHHGATVFLRASFRHPIIETMSRVGIGFRCVRPVP